MKKHGKEASVRSWPEPTCSCAGGAVFREAPLKVTEPLSVRGPGKDGCVTQSAISEGISVVLMGFQLVPTKA